MLRVSALDVRVGRNVRGAMASFYSEETENQGGGVTCPKSFSRAKTRAQVSAVFSNLSFF